MRWVLASGAVAGGALWWLLGPGARLLAGERRKPTAAERQELSVSQRLESINHARQALLQAGAGLVIIIGVVFTAAGLVYTARTLETTRQGQVTERYTSAVDQLGSARPEVRLGGIYALERLMDDSARDRNTIMEVLASYVRVHAQDRPPVGSGPTRLAVDVTAALTVIDRHAAKGRVRLNLISADFHGKNLTLPDLRDTDMNDTARHAADLSGAILRDADLRRAILVDVSLSGADLRGAVLRGANLTDADLHGADLSDADLSATNLSGVNLSRANLSGADLRSIRGRTPQQIRATAITDADTRF